MRFRGVLPGECWDAAWEADSTDVSGSRFLVWVCFISPGDAAETPEVIAPVPAASGSVLDRW
jgi:hypothetical protein